MSIPATRNTDGVTSTDRTAKGPQPDETPVAPPQVVGNGEVPIGGIVFYTGSFAAIPTNWHLCDGTGGTADLSDLFIRGTKIEGTLGATGGTLQHLHGFGTIAAAAEAAHTHAFTQSVNSATPHLVAIDTTGTGVAASGTTGAGSSHTHVISGSTALNVSGNALPPYYTLAYIQRMS